MATYECEACGMAVNASCAKCDASLVDGSLTLDDGTVVLAGLGGVVTYSYDEGETFSAVTRPDRRGHSTVAEGGDGRVIVVGEDGIIPMPARAEDYSPDAF